MDLHLLHPGSSVTMLRPGGDIAALLSEMSSGGPDAVRERRSGVAADAQRLLWCFDPADGTAASPKVGPPRAVQPGGVCSDAGAHTTGLARPCPSASASEAGATSAAESIDGAAIGATVSPAGAAVAKHSGLHSGCVTGAAAHRAGTSAGPRAAGPREGPSNDDAAATSLRGAMSMRRRAADQQRARSIRRAVRRAVQQQKTAAARMAATLAGVVGGRWGFVEFTSRPDEFQTLFYVLVSGLGSFQMSRYCRRVVESCRPWSS